MTQDTDKRQWQYLQSCRPRLLRGTQWRVLLMLWKSCCRGNMVQDLQRLCRGLLRLKVMQASCDTCRAQGMLPDVLSSCACGISLITGAEA